MSWRLFTDFLSSPHVLNSLWSPSCSCTSTLLYGLVIGALVGLLIPLLCSKALVVSLIKAWLAQQPGAAATEALAVDSAQSEPRRKLSLSRSSRTELALPSSSSQGGLDERTIKRIQSLRYVVPHQDH